MVHQQLSEEGRKARFEQWEKYGADRLKSDLETDPYRFPHPDTGHWSIIEAGLAGAGQLAPWIAGRTLQDLLVPHGGVPLLPAGIDLRHDLCWSIEKFVDRLHPQSVALVHYSGYEDQQILTDAELRNWLLTYLNAAAWQVPRPAHEFILYDGP